MEWLIQDFPEGKTNPRQGCINLFIGKVLAENFMKIKEFGSRTWSVSLAFSLGSATLKCPKVNHLIQTINRQAKSVKT